MSHLEACVTCSKIHGTGADHKVIVAGLTHTHLINFRSCFQEVEQSWKRMKFAQEFVVRHRFWRIEEKHKAYRFFFSGMTTQTSVHSRGHCPTTPKHHCIAFEGVNPHSDTHTHHHTLRRLRDGPWKSWPHGWSERPYRAFHPTWPLECLQDAYDALSCRSLSAKEPLIIGLFWRTWPIKTRHPMGHRHPVGWITRDRYGNITKVIHIHVTYMVTWWSYVTYELVTCMAFQRLHSNNCQLIWAIYMWHMASQWPDNMWNCPWQSKVNLRTRNAQWVPASAQGMDRPRPAALAQLGHRVARHHSALSGIIIQHSPSPPPSWLCVPGWQGIFATSALRTSLQFSLQYALCTDSHFTVGVCRHRYKYQHKC
jgi:hypothetical protein